jgi:hypothetical protein
MDGTAIAFGQRATVLCRSSLWEGQQPIRESDVNISVELRGRRFFLGGMGIAVTLTVFGVEARSLAEIQKTNELRACIVELTRFRRRLRTWFVR